MSEAAGVWERERPRLVGIAYRMLGDFGEAEDVVSEVALSALAAERAGSPARSWPAWLTTTCVRRSIDRVRQLASAREVYPGPWLPEPVATQRLPEDVVATRELLSLGLLHLAEQLGPDERAALVLHRAYAMTAVEIGRMLDRTPASVRQLISRAERRLDIAPDRAPSPSPAPAALAALVRDLENGDVAAVRAALADDATLWGDGGGKVGNALNPIFGADRIARFLVGILAKSLRGGHELTLDPLSANGQLALDLRRGDRRDVVFVDLAADGRVAAIRLISNPDKLTRL